MLWSSRIVLAFAGSLIPFGIGFVSAYFMLIVVNSRSHQASEFFQFILPCVSAMVLGMAG